MIDQLLMTAFVIGCVALIIFSGPKNEDNRKISVSTQNQSKTFRASTSGYDPIRQVHWKREDRIEIENL